MEEKRSGYIYKIENRLNGKCYIGQSINPKVRWSRHKYNCKNNVVTYLYDEMRKDGVDNYIFEIIYKCDKDEMDKHEKEFIDKYDSYNNGYNRYSGGKKNFKVCKETKKILSDINTGNILTEEHKKVFTRKGMKNSEAHNKAIAKAQTGLKHSEERIEANSRIQKELKKYTDEEKEILEKIGEKILPPFIIFHKRKLDKKIIGFVFTRKMNGKCHSKQISNPDICKAYQNILMYKESILNKK